MISRLKKIIPSFLDTKYYFITTNSQKTLFYPWWVLGSAFVIDSQAQKDQFFVLTKKFIIFFVIIFLFAPMIPVCLIHLPPIDQIIQSHDLAIIGLALFTLLSIFSPIFWFHWKIKKLTKGLQKLSRSETLKSLAQHHKLSHLLCGFSFLTFLIFFSSLPTVNQKFLEITAQANYLTIKYVDFTSSKSLISQICALILEKKGEDCLDILRLFFLAGTGLITLNMLILTCIIINFIFGYMIILKLQNKYKRGKI